MDLRMPDCNRLSTVSAPDCGLVAIVLRKAWANVAYSVNRAPALIAAVGERASYRFFEFFTANIRNPHTRRAYARAAVEFFDWLAARGVSELHRRRERACRRLYRAVAEGALRADRETALGGVAAFVRLAGHRPDHAGKSRRRRARAAPYRAARQDAGARSAGSAATHRRDRHHDRHRPTRPGADRLDGLFLRAHRRGDRHAGRRRVSAEPAAMGSLAREGRQATRHAVPSQFRGLPARIYRRRGAGERAEGVAVPDLQPRDRPAHRQPPAPSQRLCDDFSGARNPAASPRASATTPFAPRASPLT